MRPDSLAHTWGSVMDAHRFSVAVQRGVAAAVFSGLVSAIITRVLMRTVTLITNGTPAFSWFGSVGIAIIYIVALLPGAVALAYSTGRWPWFLFGGGIAFLAYGAIVIGLDETAHAQGLTAVRWIALVAVLAAMLATYAAQAALVHRMARGRGRREAHRRERQPQPV